MRVKPPALPEQATIAVVAPASPPQTRSEIEQATAYFEARGHEVVLRAQPPQGARLSGRDRRGARRRPAVGAERARDRHGAHALRRLRHRAAARPDRLGRGSATRASSAASATSPPCTSRSPPTPAGSRSTGPTSCASRGSKDELTEETEEWFHRAFQPEPLGRVFEDPEDPYVLTVGEGVGRGAAGRRLPDAAVREHRHALRGADGRLRGDGRGPQHRAVPGRHGAQPPGPRRQARQRRRLRVRDRRELEAIRPCPRGRSRRSRSRRSSTS